MDHALVRYLEAKRSVDDRSLSRRVRAALFDALPDEPRIVEAGAGTGSTVPRLVEAGVAGDYRGIDAAERLVAFARAVRPRELRRRGYDAVGTDRGGRVRVSGGPDGPAPDRALEFAFEVGDALTAVGEGPPADLLVAQQFMDLVPMERALDAFLDALAPGGLAYFPLTFDGTTIFQPDHPADGAVERAYHADIDAAPDRDSHAGRHLLDALRRRPGDLLAVGSSDAVVRPRTDGADEGARTSYPADEAYFLERILGFVDDTVTADEVPERDDWLATRRSQLTAGELSYVGHRYDLLYRAP